MQGEKVAFRMWEYNSKQNSWQRINPQTIQAAHAAQYEKKEQSNEKVDQIIKTFLERRHIDG